MRLRPRKQTYSMLVGIAVGMSLAGLVLPWVAGEPVSSDAVSAGSGSGTVTAGESAAGTETAAEPSATDDTMPTTSETVPGSGAVTTMAPAASAAPTSSGSPGAAPSANRATDMGVTPTTIKMGFLLLDIGNVSKLGVGVPGVDPKQQEMALRIQIDAINKAGGIHGRKIEPVFRPFDVLSRDDMRAACLDITEDAKVFAVLAAGGYEPTQGTCITKEHATPLVLLCCAIQEHLVESQGRMITGYAGANRIMMSWLGELHRTGRLKGHKIGVLNDERYDPGERMAKGALIPAFQRFGYTITHRTRLHEDLNTGASQIPNEVQQMRLKGVDVILLTSNTIYSSQFVQQADAQGYHPTYYTSDWAGLNTDATNQNMPQSYDGTLGWTFGRGGEWRVGLPEPPAGVECRKQYEAASGKQLKRDDGTAEYGVVIMWCDLVRIMSAGLRGAGADLTRAAYGAAITRAGSLPMGGVGGGTFRPGRFDFADMLRLQRWHADCRCWKPAAPFQRTPD